MRVCNRSTIARRRKSRLRAKNRVYVAAMRVPFRWHQARATIKNATKFISLTQVFLMPTFQMVPFSVAAKRGRPHNATKIAATDASVLKNGRLERKSGFCGQPAAGAIKHRAQPEAPGGGGGAPYGWAYPVSPNRHRPACPDSRTSSTEKLWAIPAKLLTPDGIFPQPKGGERFGDFRWQPSPSANVVAEVAEFAYQGNARLFVHFRSQQDPEHDAISVGQLWTTNDVWKWRVWSITNQGAVSFSSFRSFHH